MPGRAQGASETPHHSAHRPGAVWRPGSKTLPLRPVKLPAHTGGSDTFVPLVGPEDIRPAGS